MLQGKQSRLAAAIRAVCRYYDNSGLILASAGDERKPIDYMHLRSAIFNVRST